MCLSRINCVLFVDFPLWLCELRRDFPPQLENSRVGSTYCHIVNFVNLHPPSKFQIYNMTQSKMPETKMYNTQRPPNESSLVDFVAAYGISLVWPPPSHFLYSALVLSTTFHRDPVRLISISLDFYHQKDNKRGKICISLIETHRHI